MAIHWNGSPITAISPTKLAPHSGRLLSITGDNDYAHVAFPNMYYAVQWAEVNGVLSYVRPRDESQWFSKSIVVIVRLR